MQKIASRALLHDLSRNYVDYCRWGVLLQDLHTAHAITPVKRLYRSSLLSWSTEFERKLHAKAMFLALNGLDKFVAVSASSTTHSFSVDGGGDTQGETLHLFIQVVNDGEVRWGPRGPRTPPLLCISSCSLLRPRRNMVVCDVGYSGLTRGWVIKGPYNKQPQNPYFQKEFSKDEEDHVQVGI